MVLFSDSTKSYTANLLRSSGFDKNVSRALSRLQEQHSREALLYQSMYPSNPFKSGSNGESTDVDGLRYAIWMREQYCLQHSFNEQVRYAEWIVPSIPASVSNPRLTAAFTEQTGNLIYELENFPTFWNYHRVLSLIDHASGCCNCIRNRDSPFRHELQPNLIAEMINHFTETDHSTAQKMCFTDLYQ